MANHITDKQVQEHVNCSCGYNSVDQITVRVKYRDLAKAGIKRKISKSDGKPFLLWNYQMQCDGTGAAHFEYN